MSSFINLNSIESDLATLDEEYSSPQAAQTLYGYLKEKAIQDQNSRESSQEYLSSKSDHASYLRNALKRDNNV